MMTDGSSVLQDALEGANLEGAVLKEAALAGANLEEANLEGANLAYAKGITTSRWCDAGRGSVSAVAQPFSAAARTTACAVSWD